MHEARHVGGAHGNAARCNANLLPTWITKAQRAIARQMVDPEDSQQVAQAFVQVRLEPTLTPGRASESGKARGGGKVEACGRGSYACIFVDVTCLTCDR